MRDLNKKAYEPLELFLSQSKKMIERHLEFYEVLSPNVKKNINEYRMI
ncbi:MAG: hypothetical protein N3A69_03390 [Leptospiraceae bacterium]|nr:hypothetical protein [Leptospiraceae bacterium]